MPGNLQALVALGSNLPTGQGHTPLQICRNAAALLDRLPGVRLSALSRWFVSSPIPAAGQPDYVNAVAALRVAPAYLNDPALLLRHCQGIEAVFGRTRSVANAARTLDLDLIAVGGLVRSAPDPILPHPRAHERAFVLLPLLDVAPDWDHPALGRSARALAAELPPQDIRPL